MNSENILQMEEAMKNINKNGAFLTSGNKEKANTMSISWATMGHMWKKKIFAIVIADIRCTKKFIDSENTFTISVPYDGKMNHEIDLCGHMSGNEVNKEEYAGIKFTAGKCVNSPVIDGCNMYYECKVLLKQKVDVNSINEELNLPAEEKDYTMYYGEIVAEYCK